MKESNVNEFCIERSLDLSRPFVQARGQGRKRCGRHSYAYILGKILRELVPDARASQYSDSDTSIPVHIRRRAHPLLSILFELPPSLALP